MRPRCHSRCEDARRQRTKTRRSSGLFVSLGRRVVTSARAEAVAAGEPSALLKCLVPGVDMSWSTTDHFPLLLLLLRLRRTCLIVRFAAQVTVVIIASPSLAEVVSQHFLHESVVQRSERVIGGGRRAAVAQPKRSLVPVLNAISRIARGNTKTPNLVLGTVVDVLKIINE